MRRVMTLLVLCVLTGCGSDVVAPQTAPEGAVLGTASSGPARCDRWAATTGSDSAPGTVEQPLRTPQRLIDALGPGQTGCLRAGSYRAKAGEPYVLRFNHGGRRGKPLTLRSAPGERADLTGITYVPSGSNDVHIADLSLHARHIDQQHLSVGLQVMARRFVLQDSDVTNDKVTTSCVILGSNSGYGPAVRPVLRRNVFHDCGNQSDGMLDHAIYVENAVRGQIVGNVIVRAAGFGIHLYPNARRTLVSRNLLYGNGGALIFAGTPPYASSGNSVRRNVLGGSTSRAEITSSYGGRVGTGNRVSGNCFYPGQAPWDGDGYRTSGNVVAKTSPFAAPLRLRDGTSCRRSVGTDPAAGLSSSLVTLITGLG